ncbi:MAG: hypothetical protein JL50_17265 [Peptococcaceae bacterium BICA1-7]|nr:MAG: hypothetical protein JL50_17265 [Peptococcaceae bacterium BICA1-7]HBV98701.1 hypothetical protein [Desulfotomaculum sp.]
MEVVISILCALAGLLCGLMFLWDFASLSANGGNRRGFVKVAVKLLIALLLLHFHFELDILD